MGDWYEDYPHLHDTDWRKTSEPNAGYNCVAWAIRVNYDWLEADPMGIYSWPKDVPRLLTVNAYQTFFEKRGFRITQSEDLETGIEKVALFADANCEFKHVARQLPNGKWTSKLGKDLDIEHYLRDLEGPFYGSVVLILGRPL